MNYPSFASTEASAAGSAATWFPYRMVCARAWDGGASGGPRTARRPPASSRPRVVASTGPTVPPRSARHAIRSAMMTGHPARVSGRSNASVRGCPTRFSLSSLYPPSHVGSRRIQRLRLPSPPRPACRPGSLPGALGWTTGAAPCRRGSRSENSARRPVDGAFELARVIWSPPALRRRRV
jgi:hypothetical protein